MGIANNKLTAPMSWGDISVATGVGGPPYAMGNMVDVSTILNKWSKVHPFEPATSIVAFSSAAHRDALAKAVNYGWSSDGIPVYTTANELHAGFDPANQGNVWKRKAKPTRWWRSGPYQDLDGYVLDASGWGLGKWSSGESNYLNAPFNAYIECLATVGDGNFFFAGISADSSGAADGLFSLSDFTGLIGGFDLATWYFGVALIRKNASSGSGDYFYVFGDAISGDLAKTITITSTIANGDYYLVPILAQSNANADHWESASGFPTRCVTLDGWYTEVTKTSSAGGFTFSAGLPYLEGGVLKVDVTFSNRTGTGVTINQMFSYAQADATNQQMSYYNALVNACRYWVNSKAEQTGGAGVKVDNVVVAVYKQLATSLVIPASSSPVTYTYVLTDGASDALGNPYDPNTDVRLCLLYDNNYVCNNIY